jgi:hypothetical protein
MEVDQHRTETVQKTGLASRPQCYKPGQSGNPLGPKILTERAAALFDTVVPDFPALSATDTVLLKQACRLLARSERMRDPDASIRMASEARRTLDGLRRRQASKREQEQKGSELSAYLAAQYGSADERPSDEQTSEAPGGTEAPVEPDECDSAGIAAPDEGRVHGRGSGKGGQRKRSGARS